MAMSALHINRHISMTQLPAESSDNAALRLV
jgi:hypothetical protein